MSDGYLLRGRVWPAASKTRTAILYLHGIQSHGGWFEWSASLLASRGATVVLPDRRGSGLNGEPRGDTPSVERWLLDLEEIGGWMKSTLAMPRIAVLGVSWGGKLAAALAAQRPELVSGVLLVAPGFFPAVDVGLATRVGIAAALLTGGTRHFEIPLQSPALFTDNPDGQRFIERDTLKLTHATARMLWRSSQLDRRLRRLPRGALRMPITLMLAGRDRIIHNPPTEAWIRRIADSEPTIVHFPDQAHTLEFAANVAAYQRALEEWLASIPSMAVAVAKKSERDAMGMRH